MPSEETGDVDFDLVLTVGEDSLSHFVTAPSKKEPNYASLVREVAAKPSEGVSRADFYRVLTVSED